MNTAILLFCGSPTVFEEEKSPGKIQHYNHEHSRTVVVFILFAFLADKGHHIFCCIRSNTQKHFPMQQTKSPSEHSPTVHCVMVRQQVLQRFRKHHGMSKGDRRTIPSTHLWFTPRRSEHRSRPLRTRRFRRPTEVDAVDDGPRLMWQQRRKRRVMNAQVQPVGGASLYRPDHSVER